MEIHWSVCDPVRAPKQHEAERNLSGALLDACLAGAPSPLTSLLAWEQRGAPPMFLLGPVCYVSLRSHCLSILGMSRLASSGRATRLSSLLTLFILEAASRNLTSSQ